MLIVKLFNSDELLTIHPLVVRSSSLYIIINIRIIFFNTLILRIYRTTLSSSIVRTARYLPNDRVV